MFYFIFIFIKNLVVDGMRIRRNLTGETTLASKDDNTSSDHTGPHEELNPSGGDDVVLSEGGAEVGRADVVKLQRDDLTVTDGFRHVDVLCHFGGTEGGGSDGRGGAADTSGGSNTAEHFCVCDLLFKMKIVFLIRFSFCCE